MESLSVAQSLAVCGVLPVSARDESFLGEQWRGDQALLFIVYVLAEQALQGLDDWAFGSIWQFV